MIERRDFSPSGIGRGTPRFLRGRMSVGCSTTQSNSLDAMNPRKSANLFSLKNPQSAQDGQIAGIGDGSRNLLRLIIRFRTIKAMRSAEQVNAGICRSCAIKFPSAAGYSVLLKTSALV
jgi:hypothetical protein